MADVLLPCSSVARPTGRHPASKSGRRPLEERSSSQLIAEQIGLTAVCCHHLLTSAFDGTPPASIYGEKGKGLTLEDKGPDSGLGFTSCTSATVPACSRCGIVWLDLILFSWGWKWDIHSAIHRRYLDSRGKERMGETSMITNNPWILPADLSVWRK